jgi:hypothetical protein
VVTLRLAARNTPMTAGVSSLEEADALTDPGASTPDACHPGNWDGRLDLHARSRIERRSARARRAIHGSSPWPRTHGRWGGAISWSCGRVSSGPRRCSSRWVTTLTWPTAAPRSRLPGVGNAGDEDSGEFLARAVALTRELDDPYAPLALT